MPIIMVTARADTRDVVAGLEAGADEYLTKPVDQTALVARVKSMLRIKALHDTVQEQAQQLAEWNQTLEQRVQEQLGELERVGRLKRFFSPQLAELVVSAGGEKLLQSHRREVTVVFCDLRGYTSFTETVEPEEVIEVLREYHTTLGRVIFRFQGTLERFAGDGLMVFFNDPLPCPDHAIRAIHMAVAMRQEMQELTVRWQRRGHQLAFGIGIAQGYATLGMIGFEGRVDYAAIGPTTNLAARLCEAAQGGQILISQRVHAAVENHVAVEPIDALALKGLRNPVVAFNVVGLQAEKPG
jgi:class 3 adenylate cyclase